MIKPEINRDRLFNLFRDMVNIYSPSGKEEEITGYLKDYITEAGLSVKLREVDETRFNLEIMAEQGEADILFLGHIDTVPAFNIDSYELTENEGLCYGLGAADMKSGCAAMIEAFITAHENGILPKNVMLSLVVGEEETGDGTEALLSNHDFKWALVAEPTGVNPCLVHYGYVEMVTRIFGYRKHAAMADKNSNAIRAMLGYLMKMEDRFDLKEVATVMNFRDLKSSESGFAVPDRCTAVIDFHIPAGISAGEYSEQLNFVATEILSESNVTSFEFEFSTLADGYRIKEDGFLPSLLRKIYDSRNILWKTDSFKSHSDANLLMDAGCNPVILGPGHLEMAHTDEESVDFEEVVTTSQIYTDLLGMF